ncbi:hypothetical protein RJ640_025172, partial [Escallonia rubra]
MASDPSRYRRLIGRLIYLTLTRPGILFVVHALSQHMQPPRQSRWHGAICVVHYLKGSPGLCRSHSAGRFSNGKLVPDFLASVLGIKEAVPPFLQPDLSDDELRTGVNFASGGAGFDDLAGAAFGIIPVSKQLRSGTLRALPFRNRNHMDKGDVLDLIHMPLNEIHLTKVMQPIFFFILSVQVCTLVTCSSESITKFPAILIFGDSTVDTGNNDYIPTIAKGNHRPYGQDFPGHIPTGRFSNGKLVPDFLVSALGIKEAVPPFLQPNLSDDELCTGVSFASGGAGFDDLTSAAIGIIPVSKQPRYLESYIERLRGVVGEEEAQRIVNGALVVVSAGTTDLIFNFYDIPRRKPFFTIEAYQDFLQDKIQNFTKDLYNLGCRTIVVSGLPPIGCLPIQMTTKSILRNCVRSQNSDSLLYNDKLVKVLPRLQASLPGSRILYADVYKPLMDMINNPGRYGFLETGRGCCGTGLVEAGPSCTPVTPLCANRSQYLFFDSIHPGESAYHIVTEYLKKDILHKLLNKAAPRSGTLHLLPFRNRNHFDKQNVLGLIHLLLNGSMKTNPSWQKMQPTFFIILIVQVCTLVTCSSGSATKFHAILIFGDSTVDTGNNNYIPTIAKANYRPYGLDFPSQLPTGRFSSGKLVPDFLASVLGIKEAVPPFLQPNLSDDELRTGVSFASAGAGFDDLTSAALGIIPVSKQPGYFKTYIERLTSIAGEEAAQRIVSGAFVVVSAGSNDLIFSFYDIPISKPYFTIEEYQDFLQDKIQNITKELYSLGCRTILVAGLPPIGCVPIQLTTKSILRNCLQSQNSDSQHYNGKLMKLLPRLQASLPGSRILYGDLYTPVMDMINNPGKYGFLETGRGCCGTGLVEAGPLCTPVTPLCANRSQCLFFDSIHPGESAYHIVTEYLNKEILHNLTQ